MNSEPTRLTSTEARRTIAIRLITTVPDQGTPRASTVCFPQNSAWHIGAEPLNNLDVTVVMTMLVFAAGRIGMAIPVRGKRWELEPPGTLA
jgi:hypothetical protein